MADKKNKKKTIKKESVSKNATTKLNDSLDDAKEFVDDKAEILTAKAKKASKKVEAFTHDAEEKIDEVAQKAKSYIEGRGKEDLEEFKKETGEKIEIVADGVEHVGEAIEEVAEGLFPSDHTGSFATYEATWNASVNRLFIFRFLWMIIEGPIIYVWSMWYALITIYHVILMLINGKRNRDLWERQQRFWRHMIQRKAYICGLTDRRPLFIEK